jgi:hypothetical protein
MYRFSKQLASYETEAKEKEALDQQHYLRCVSKQKTLQPNRLNTNYITLSFCFFEIIIASRGLQITIHCRPLPSKIMHDANITVLPSR